MGGELQLPRAPARDLDYWLRRCEGFRVDSPEGRVGTVEGLRFLTRPDRPDALAVRTGLFVRRVVIVPVGEVAEVAPREQCVRLTNAPRADESGLLQQLRAHLRRPDRQRMGADPGGSDPQGSADEVARCAAQMLLAARARLERGWCQWDHALNADGDAVEPWSLAACRWSIGGSLSAVWQEWRSDGSPAELVSRGFRRAVDAVRATIGDTIAWNDAPERTQVEVLAALDRALVLAQSAVATPVEIQEGP